MTVVNKTVLFLIIVCFALVTLLYRTVEYPGNPQASVPHYWLLTLSALITGATAVFLRRRLFSGPVRCTVIPGNDYPIHPAHAMGETGGGEPYRMIGVLSGVSKPKRRGEVLRRYEELNSTLLTQNPNPIAVIDDSVTVQYVNPAFERLTGYTHNEIMGIAPPYPWWPEEMQEKYERELKRAIRSGWRKSECLYRKKSGRSFWAERVFCSLKLEDKLLGHFIYLTDITTQKKLKANMEFYISEITMAQEEERRRIACELHDETVQSLASIALEIDAVSKAKNKVRDDIVERLKDVRNRTKRVIDNLRQFSQELHPGIIEQGLVPSLELLTEELGGEKKMDIQVIVSGNERRMAPEAELCIFRIAQEALRNIGKHSQATEAAVRLRFSPASVTLGISDNGVGFELPEMLGDLAGRHKLGLVSMQERSRLLNGKFAVKTRKGKGTTVVVKVPVSGRDISLGKNNNQSR